MMLIGPSTFYQLIKIQGFWKKVSLLFELLVGILLKIQLKAKLFFQKPCIAMAIDEKFIAKKITKAIR